jgi:aryl-alcohol dehydrogenase-like predicted oxidoreductase
MRYTSLGTSPLQISELAFGCMSLGEDDAANARLLHSALEGGITLFDTADLYQQGQNEQTVGKAFKGMRHKVILATKVGNQWRPDGSGWDWNPRKDYILSAVNVSLKRLQTDYIDLYQLHGGTLEDPIDETIEAFEELKAAGKIRNYGISSIRPNVIREWVKRSAIASVMMQYSLLDRRPEESSLQLLAQHGIGVLARGSYAQGLLLGKPPKAYLGYTAEEVEKAASGLQALAGSSRTPAALAARYSLAPPAVNCAVLGIRNQKQLDEALAIAHTPPLSPQELDQLQKILPPNYYEQHR